MFYEIKIIEYHYTKNLKKLLMIRLWFIITFSIFSNTIFATTWDEPWQDKVIKEADFFVLAKIVSFDRYKSVTIEIVKSLAGNKIEGTIEITNFYLLSLCSGGRAKDFYFDGISECYFFLKKNDKGEYCISTPSSGVDYIIDGKVVTSYRHSYHRLYAPIEVYENTMTAIFNNYHNKSYDKRYIKKFVSKYISLKPAGYDSTEINTFYAQHIALECIYHLRLPNYYSKIIPFIEDTSNLDHQVSAARALIAYNTKESKKQLLKLIGDNTNSCFVQVMCIWSLNEFHPKELIEELKILKDMASTEYCGFGGSIMDPRVCTRFPDVKEALSDLIKSI